MSMVYQLELTDEEKECLIVAVMNEQQEFSDLRLPYTFGVYRGLEVKLRALEPVGTEGGS